MELVIGNQGEEHTRMATSIVASLANIGGLTEFFFTGCWLLYIFFGQPFRDLDLAISFNKLKSQIDGDSI